MSTDRIAQRMTPEEYFAFARDHRDHFVELYRERLAVAAAAPNGADVLCGLAMAAGYIATLTAQSGKITAAVQALHASLDKGACEAMISPDRYGTTPGAT